MAHVKLFNKDKEEVKSVTTIIGKNLGWNKELLMAWSRKCGLAGLDPNAVKDQAADTGTLCHDMIDNYIRGTEFEYKEHNFDSITVASVGLEAYKEWEQRQNIQYLHNEVSVVSETYQYGGTFDCVAVVDGVVSLVDFKTSKGVYADHIIQLSAYKQAIEESIGIKIEQCILIKIPKDMKEDSKVTPYYIKSEIITEAFDVFKVLVNLESSRKILEGYANEICPYVKKKYVSKKKQASEE
jgi:hypothetical protein